MVATGSVKMEQKPVNGNMIQTLQILASGGLIQAKKEPGSKMKMTTPSRLAAVTHHLMISTVNIIIDMVNLWPGGGTTLLIQVVTGPVRMDLRQVNGPMTKAQQPLAPGGLMIFQIMAHGLKTKMIQALNAILLHLSNNLLIKLFITS